MSIIRDALIIEHTGFKTLTPSGGSSCPNYFWLSDAQFARLQPLLPGKVRSVPRVDDQKVISGIIYVIRYGLKWRDAPACYGPHKTLYNRFARWSRAGVFDRIFQALAAEGAATKTVMIDSTHLKAHRTAASLLKGGGFSTPDRTHPGRAELQAPRRLSTASPSCCG